MTTGALRSLTLHAPPATPAKLRLPSGELVDLTGAVIEVEPIAGEKVTTWPKTLIITTKEARKP